MTAPTSPAWYQLQINAAAPADEGIVAEVMIYGNIGDRWDADGVIAAEFVRELAELDVDIIRVRINSYGGSVTEGLAIFNALRRHRATIETYIDGIAASCASYIAMAGDTVHMARNAQLMIHAPWGYAIGNAPQLREAADLMDRYALSLAAGYARPGGLEYDACLELVTDGADHWFSADEAVESSLVDVITDPMPVAAALAASFDLSRFRASASLARPAVVVAGAAPVAASEPTSRATPIVADTAEEQTMPQSTISNPEGVTPVARTKKQNQELVALFQPFLQGNPELQALQTECLTDPAMSLDQARTRLLDALGAGAEPATPQNRAPRVEVLEDELDKRKEGVALALLARAGQGGVDRNAMAANPFRGLSLLDLARASLERAGVRAGSLDKMQLVAAAFTTSTSDFPILLETAMHKSLLRAYDLAEPTWPRFCRRGSVSDFRAHGRYRVGGISTLDVVGELEEFKNKAIADGEKATITAETRGNIVNLSRQAIVNDDLGAFVGLSATLGRAAARTVDKAVFDLLAQNAGMGPTIGGYALFNGTYHHNEASAGTLSVSVVSSLRAKLAAQKDASGEVLDLRPAVLLVPMDSGADARVINDAQYDPDTAGKLQRPNTVRGLFRDIVDSPRLSGTRVYAFADPELAPTFEVAFLDGQDAPFLELQNGFDVDGARYKVRLDFGVAALDWRSAATAAGS